MSEEQKLSTTRIAELAHIEGKQLFKLLTEHGWIVRIDGHWRLTAHGEFEGGSYQHSEKYGDYIVWPASIIENPLLAEFEEDWLSATKIGEGFGVSAHRINSLLSELAWIDKDQRGWMITERGSKLGGEQRSGDKGFYVMWPKAVKHQAEFKTAIENVLGKAGGCSLDGHAVVNSGEQQIDNWLYLNGIAHAYKRPLPGSDLCCTFYLPARKVYIDYWGFDLSTGPLSEKLAKEAFYQSHGLKLISLHDEDLTQLDDVLPQKLLQFGIQIYST
jgi:hypothetical protein